RLRRARDCSVGGRVRGVGGGGCGPRLAHLGDHCGRTRGSRRNRVGTRGSPSEAELGPMTHASRIRSAIATAVLATLLVGCASGGPAPTSEPEASAPLVPLAE